MGVHVDKLWVSAANNGDEGRERKPEEGVGGYGGRESSEIFLALTTEEVADKDDEDSPGNVLASVETPEGVRLAVAIEDMVVFDLLDSGQAW